MTQHGVGNLQLRQSKAKPTGCAPSYQLAKPAIHCRGAAYTCVGWVCQLPDECFGPALAINP